MQSTDLTVSEYISEVPEERKNSFIKLRECILNNKPEGIVEEMSYGMIGYVVPHSIYPDGYHCNPKLPLPFMNIASQKNFIALYHMGIYADPVLMEWFITEYPKHTNLKLDMGKSCIRFKKMDQIPFELIAELCKRMTVEDWIECYDNKIKNRKS